MITSVNAFPFGLAALQTATAASGFHQCLDPPCPLWTGLVAANIVIIFETAKKKQGNLA